ncbi:hypothetical protein [Myroides sp. LJL119]
MKFQKILTYIVLTGLVYGIFNFDVSNMWSLQANWLSFLGFIIFLIYLAYSLKQAAKKQDFQNNKD